MEKQNNKTDKLTDKAFSRLWITSILGILICLVCLCSTTWAWFSADVTADSNTLSSGQFDLDIFVEDPNSNEIAITKRADGKMSCTLGKGTYTVTLKMTDDTTATRGFCVINVGEETYYTASIIDSKDFTFTIDAKEDGMTVTFAPSWGYPADVKVEKGETLPIGTENASAE